MPDIDHTSAKGATFTAIKNSTTKTKTISGGSTFTTTPNATKKPETIILRAIMKHHG